MPDSVAGQLPEHLLRLWRFALRLTKNTHQAEDLVQRTCLQALEKKHLYREQNQMCSWLFAILYRLWLNDFATRQFESFDDEAWEALPSDSPNLETIVFYQQVREAVEQLPEPYRSTLLLVGVEECSYEECAQILDIPVGTVMSRVSRARQMIGQGMTKTLAHTPEERNGKIVPFKRQVKS